jgi:FeS assembly SUF system regulator
MRLSSLSDYAIVILSAIARSCGNARLNATLIAADTGIPLPTVQKLVSKLSSANLLRSSRGTGGGVKLARPAAAITLTDIIEAVEGPIAMTACVEAGSHDCVVEGNCRVKPHWDAVNGAVRSALGSVTLASLTTPFVPSDVEGRDSGKACLDFARHERIEEARI